MHKHATKIHGFVDEHRATLRATDIDALRDDVRALGLGDWRRWCEAHESDVMRLLCAPPAQRIAQQKRRAPEFRRRLVMAAIRHLEYAEQMLRVAGDLAHSCDGSSRGAAAAAGQLYWELIEFDVADWPFEGENPFDGS